MGIFSFGGSKQESEQVGSSRAFDVAASGSVSGGVSDAGSRATSGQSIAFEDVFSRLFGGAEGAAAGLDPSVLTGAANQLFSGGINFLESLGGGPGTDFLQSRVAGESPVLQEQIDLLQQDVGRLFSEELNPAITSEAVAGGTLGGGRQGVAQGLAAEAAANEFTRGATALRAGDIAARDAAAGTLGEQTIAGAGVGLGGLSALSNLANLGFGAELAPFERLAAILGPQTALTASESESFSSAEDFARAFSQSFGSSQSDTRSSSSGRSFRLGFGD